MPIPSVTCNADVVDVEGSLPVTAVLGASATESPTQWRWSMISVPIGSSADSGANGDFTDGEAVIQAPEFDADVRGSYVLQALALNVNGWSDPLVDREAGQQIVVIKSTALDLPIPGDRQYDWATYMDDVVRKLEVAAATAGAHALGGAIHTADTLANLNSKVSDATLIDTADGRLSDARTPLAHALGGAEHGVDSLANLNAKVTGGDLDFDTASRPPSGAASGQLGGSYPGPDVRGLRTTTGPTLLTVGAVADGEFIKRVGSTVIGGAAGAATYLALTDTPSTRSGQAGKIVTVNLGETGDEYVERGSFAPGARIEILDLQPAGAQASTGSYAKITGSDVAFEVPATALYDLFVELDCFGTSGGATGRFQLVFDLAGTPITVGGDAEGNRWNIKSAGASEREYRTKTAQVQLIAGAHTVEAQFKTIAGTSVSVDAESNVTIVAVPVVGSGLGGEVGDEYAMVANQTVAGLTGSPSAWVAGNDGVQDLKVSAAVSGPTDVVHVGGLINYSVTITGMNVNIGVGINAADPVDPNMAQIDMTSSTPGNEKAWTPNLRFTGLAAGTYEFRLMFRQLSGGAGTFRLTGVTNFQSHLHATVYRGGQFPVEQDGVVVGTQLSALNVVGPGLQASAVGDKIHLEHLPNPVTASASGPVALTAADSGKLFTNEGAAAEVEFNLPAAAPGLEFSFVVQDVDGVQVNAAAGDTIRIAASVSAAAGLIEATAIGNAVKLKAINATEWVATSVVGTWTVT